MKQGRHDRPRSSRLVHSASFRATNPNKASMTLMLAAARIKVMDALFGFLAQNDAERCKRELLGRSWRRDWAMHKFQEQIRIRSIFPVPGEFPCTGKKSRYGCSGFSFATVNQSRIHQPLAHRRPKKQKMWIVDALDR